MNPDQYCEQKVAASNSSFSYSFMFLEPEARRAITTLYAFCREADDAVDECKDAGVARAKLQWWRGEIANVFEGTPQHPVGKALQPTVQLYNLPQEYFMEILDGMEMDLDHSNYPSFAALSLYCYRAASVVGLMAAEIFGYSDRRTLKYAHDLGMAFQLTNILRDIGEDARRGRIYIPLEELSQFGVTVQDISTGNLTSNMRELLRHQAQRARHYYQQAYSHLPDTDRYRQRSGLIMAAVYEATLKAIEEQDYQVFNKRISLSAPRKVWIAWQTARQEKRKHLILIDEQI